MHPSVCINRTLAMAMLR